MSEAYSFPARTSSEILTCPTVVGIPDLRTVGRIDISKLFGLPAHPLLVHAPVVLIPLVGIGAIAMACSARVRERYGWLVLATAIVAGISVQLAIGSGKALRHSVPNSVALSRHKNIAESLRPLILALFLVALAVMLIDRRTRGSWPFRGAASATPSIRPMGTLARIALIALTVVVAVGTNVRLFQIGDSGAKATWQRVHIRSGRESDQARPG
jgi:hypothetical protein